MDGRLTARYHAREYLRRLPKAPRHVPLPSDFEDPEFATVMIQRDLFYRYDTLMENVSDPSHIEFAHHKVVSVIRFFFFIISVNKLMEYALFGNVRVETSGDINQQYMKLTFTPTQADRFVLAFWNWLRRHGNSELDWFGSPTKDPLPSTVLFKRQMLDRYEQHTLKCSSCKGAYNAFQTLQKVLIAATVVLCATAGLPSEMMLRAVLGGGAIVSAALAYLLFELQKNFVFVDYVHADIV
ncbi:hypothetical protein H6P81_018031 [Aristolochia fimbriata]|uniref:Pheophorbide a oxygenase domain-containing protein n=1 Tax=Aristolochia fimbriata TaxID=158543 RepID=A0AAV7E094_ARIFI|nr:hypothetical protein H6P81_018031 [Aristolochia fimbriata]